MPTGLRKKRDGATDAIARAAETGGTGRRDAVRAAISEFRGSSCRSSATTGALESQALASLVNGRGPMVGCPAPYGIGATAAPKSHAARRASIIALYTEFRASPEVVNEGGACDRKARVGTGNGGRTGICSRAMLRLLLFLFLSCACGAAASGGGGGGGDEGSGGGSYGDEEPEIVAWHLADAQQRKLVFPCGQETRRTETGVYSIETPRCWVVRADEDGGNTWPPGEDWVGPKAFHGWWFVLPYNASKYPTREAKKAHFVNYRDRLHKPELARNPMTEAPAFFEIPDGMGLVHAWEKTADNCDTLAAPRSSGKGCFVTVVHAEFISLESGLMMAFVSMTGENYRTRGKPPPMVRRMVHSAKRRARSWLFSGGVPPGAIDNPGD